MSDVPRRESDGMPIADGYVLLIMSRCPWEGDIGSTESNYPYQHKLEFKDYDKGFVFEPHTHVCLNESPGSAPAWLKAKHNEGHMEYYMMHNILYYEWYSNSDEVAEALREWRAEQSKVTKGTLNGTVTPVDFWR